MKTALGPHAAFYQALRVLRFVGDTIPASSSLLKKYILARPKKNNPTFSPRVRWLETLCSEKLASLFSSEHCTALLYLAPLLAHPRPKVASAAMDIFTMLGDREPSKVAPYFSDINMRSSAV